MTERNRRTVRLPIDLDIKAEAERWRLHLSWQAILEKALREFLDNHAYEEAD